MSVLTSTESSDRPLHNALLRTLLVLFTIELLVMNLLPSFQLYTSGWLEVLIDASLLTLFSAPLIYYWGLAPLRKGEATIWGLTPSIASVGDALRWSLQGEKTDLSLGVVVAIFGVGIFSIESAIMLIFQLFDAEHLAHRPLLDASLLTLAAAPLLYLLLSRYQSTDTYCELSKTRASRRFLSLFVPLLILVAGLGMVMLSSELEQRRSEQQQANLNHLQQVRTDLNHLLQEAGTTLQTLAAHPRLTRFIEQRYSGDHQILSDFRSLLSIGKRFSRLCYFQVNGNPEFCLQVDTADEINTSYPLPLSRNEINQLTPNHPLLLSRLNRDDGTMKDGLRLAILTRAQDGDTLGALVLDIRPHTLSELLARGAGPSSGEAIIVTPRGELLGSDGLLAQSDQSPLLGELSRQAGQNGFSARVSKSQDQLYLSHQALFRAQDIQQPAMAGWGVAVLSPSIWSEPSLRHFVSNLLLLLLFLVPLLAGGCGVLTQTLMARRLASHSLWKKQRQLMDTINAMEQEIEARERAERQLDLADEVFQSSAEGIVVTAPNGTICSVNPAFTTITGYTQEEAVGQNMSLLSSGRQERMFYQNLWSHLVTNGHWKGELMNRRKDGTIYPQQGSITCVRDEDGFIRHYIYIFSDVSELRQSTHNLERMMHYDRLTDLPNRLLLIDRLRRACARAKVTGGKTVVLYIDLYLFKRINDTFGFDAGDRVIKEVARRLTDLQPEESTLARLRDDEFVLVLDRVESSEELTRICDDLLEAVSRSVSIEGESLKLTSNIGITLFPEDNSSESELINNASTALIKAKKRGPNQYEFFSEEMGRDSARQLALEHNLRRALDNQEFSLYYQPQVSVNDGRIIGAEALVRWNDSISGRLINPGEFISMAEQSGLIIPLGEWILETACQQIAKWDAMGFSNMRIGVNLSPIQFRNSDIVETVRRCLASSGIRAEQLDIELTEGAIMDEAFDASRRVMELHNLGVMISIDDFGTGYSSLSYLKRFPIHMLKIDQSFIRSILDDHADLAITESVNQLGKNLGKLVIAEGVENWGQFELLRKLGLDMIQGFLFSKPVPVDVMNQLLRQGGSPGWSRGGHWDQAVMTH